MAVAFIRNHTAGTDLVAGATVSFTLSAAVPAGNLIQVWVGFDNLTLTTPVVSSIGKQAGETANWIQVAFHDSQVASSHSGTRGEMWLIVPTVTWAAAAYTVTLSASVVVKAVVVSEFSGVGISLRGTAGSGTSPSGGPTATTGGTAPITGDLVLGGASCENNLPYNGDGDTTNGSWSGVNTILANGGSVNTSVNVQTQYKIVTGGGHQTFNPVGGTDSGCVVLALTPTVINDCSVWNGTAEVPANVTVWNGTAEVAANLEFA